MKLQRKYVDKPWGRNVLPPIFDNPTGRCIGEIWFTDGDDLPLLAKYIFTSQKLSIQVHPNDEHARARGLPQGKSECWYVLDADPGATLGLGVNQGLSPSQLREAAVDGSIEALMNWRAVRPGDFFFIPPGTIHAIGAGITLIEFQQNVDVTYRLYDYGRPRQLHLTEGLAVATTHSYPDELAQHVCSTEERVLVDNSHFTLVHARSDALSGRQRWVLPIEGQVWTGEEEAAAGDCILVKAGERLECDGRMLIGAEQTHASSGSRLDRPAALV